MSRLDDHSRMRSLEEALLSGKLGDVEIAGIFSGKESDPFQIAARDRKTGKVSLISRRRWKHRGRQCQWGREVALGRGVISEWVGRAAAGFVTPKFGVHEAGGPRTSHGGHRNVIHFLATKLRSDQSPKSKVGRRYLVAAA